MVSTADAPLEKTPYSPTPWNFREMSSGDYFLFVVYSADGTVVVELGVRGDAEGAMLARAKADAALIAQMPRMLDAVRLIAGPEAEGGSGFHRVQDIRDAARIAAEVLRAIGERA
jgi:hypothetical protein